MKPGLARSELAKIKNNALWQVRTVDLQITQVNPTHHRLRL